ncbi:MAG: hypothetical protein ABFS46_08995 [Myxococcota bacterium]
MATRSLTLAQVKPGDLLPPLAVEVSATTVILGALASRDWRPMHHDRDFAQQRNGVRDIFMNTPNQAAWFERYLTDWTGPRGRLARMRFGMKDSVFVGDRMEMRGIVEEVERDSAGCGFATVNVTLTADGRPATHCQARVALPVGGDDNPWRRKGDDWNP